MRAVVYNGPRDVAVRDVPDARIEKPTDVLVRITSTNICGSDLHMYEGRTDFPQGGVFGRENLGQVAEVGNAVDRVKVGDWVAVPFNIDCGFCKNCERGLSAFCLTTADRSVVPNMAGAAYGFADMAPYRGVGEAVARALQEAPRRRLRKVADRGAGCRGDDGRLRAQRSAGTLESRLGSRRAIAEGLANGFPADQTDA